MSSAGSVDYRSGSRRRGDALYTAIYRATLDELRAVGYADLTMEGVAARARASKGSLYRRWPSRAQLVVDAVHHTLPSCGELPDTGSVRGDLLGCLQGFVRLLNGPSGEAIRGLMAEVIRNPDLREIIRTRFVDPGVMVVLEALRRGAARGEVRPSALTPRIASVGPELLRQHVLVHGTPV
ncbi:MAG: TetR/AcrR family transcriptional regulator, partial [Pseudonocardiaceae bacterium]